MVYRKQLVTVLVGIALGGAGCSSSYRGSSAALRDGDPTRAESLAQEHLASNDDDWVSWRDLGIARYQLTRPAEALDPLGRALSLRPEDRQTLLFRGRAYDAIDSIPKAIAAYGAYVARAKGKDEATVRGRMEQLRLQLMKADIARIVAREHDISRIPLQRNTIAVPDFANPAMADTLRPVAKGLAVMTITDLLRIDSLRVVERDQLTTLLDELRRANPRATEASSASAPQLDPVSSVKGQQQRLAGLRDPSGNAPLYGGETNGRTGPEFIDAVKRFQKAHGLTADGIAGRKTQSALDEEWARLGGGPAEATQASSIDPGTAPRLGRLLGAQRIVQGSILPLGAERIQVAADLENTLTSEAIGTTPPIEGAFTEILELQKRLVFEILELLGIRPGNKLRRELEQRGTRDLQAFLAYCRGLDLEDRGLRSEALDAYREAISRDPGFGLASRSAATLSVGANDLQETEQSEASELGGESLDVGDRAAETGDRLGIAPTDGNPTALDTRRPDNLRGGTIVVEGEIPGGGRK
jgi:peptidoglycan hydrolase-like protein with peptidoglycan-binding domain